MGVATNRLLRLLIQRLDGQTQPPAPATPQPIPVDGEIPYSIIRAVLADPRTLSARIYDKHGCHSRVLLAPETWLKIEHNEWGAVQTAQMVYPDGTEREVDPVAAGMVRDA